ncbi:unnamed protein product [Boreogadus saida]
MNTVKAIKNAIVCLVLLPRFLVAAVLFWLLDFLCIRKRVFFRMRPHEEEDAIDPPLCISDSNRLCTLESLKAAFHGLVQQHEDVADYLVVYIEEAHPSDGWVSSDAPYQIPKHRCLEDRLSAAQLMRLEVPGCAVVVDNMENATNAAYGAYFDRLYVLHDGKIVYQGGRGPEGYRISELRDWLNHYRQTLLLEKPKVVMDV